MAAPPVVGRADGPIVSGGGQVSMFQNYITEQVPHGWKVLPFWSLFKRVKKIGYPNEQLLSVYRDYGVIPKSSRDDNHNKESEDLSGYQLVTKGALVTNKMKAWQGSIAISRYQGIVSPAYYVYEPQSDECDQFLHYLLRSRPYIALYARISKGVRVNQWDLEHEALRNIPIVLPSLQTQRAIADFLDSETARIDDLIAKKQRLVALIGEKREALIEKNILCGINQNTQKIITDNIWFPVTDKDTQLLPLKRVVRLINGYAFSSDDFGDHGIPVLRIGDVGSFINVEGAKKFSGKPSRNLEQLGLTHCKL